MDEIITIQTITELSPAPYGYFAKYLDALENREKYIPVISLGMVEVKEQAREKRPDNSQLFAKALILWEDGNIYPAESLLGFIEVLYDPSYEINSNPQEETHKNE